jgi:DNA-binding transcriptional MerR regulator
MLKIGEFAALAQISIRMLRHYDDLGLLKPDHIDAISGYRYYTPEQLPRLNRILALKEMGLSLDEVRLLLNETLTAEEISGMLKLRLTQTQHLIASEQARLRRLETRLHQIEQEGHLPDVEIVVKSLPALRILSLTGTGYPGDLFQQLRVLLQAYCLSDYVRGYITLYHSSLEFQRTGRREGGVVNEVGWMLKDGVDSLTAPPRDCPVSIRQIPAYSQVASLVSTRPDRERHLDAQVLWLWMRQHGYRLIAPSREIYLRRPGLSRPDTYLTEMLFPIEALPEESG